MIGTAQRLITWLVAKMPEDPDKEYELKEHKKHRTLTQNSYYWQLLGQVARALKLSNTELHNRMIADFGYIDPYIKTIILRDDIDWTQLRSMHLKPSTATRSMDDGKLWRVYYVMRGSHEYNTQEMSRLIDGLVEEAKAQGIETLTPEELARLRGRYE